MRLIYHNNRLYGVKCAYKVREIYLWRVDSHGKHSIMFKTNGYNEWGQFIGAHVRTYFIDSRIVNKLKANYILAKDMAGVFKVLH